MRRDRLCAGLDLVLDQRGADMVDLPGGASGLRVRGYKGKEADRLVTRIDPGVVSLVIEFRGHGRQATGELERWETGVEEPKPLDASPAAITLVMLLTAAELEDLEKRALELERRRRWSPRRDRRSSAGARDWQAAAVPTLHAAVLLPRRGHHRARNLQPQRARRSPPNALGSAARPP